MTYSLYTDGSHYAYLNAAGIGGYLLDGKGNKLWEFSEQLPNDLFLPKHEIYALEYGLKKCIESGIKDIKCFMDDKNIVEILNIKDKDQLDVYLQREKTLKNHIIPLLNKFNSINFYYLPRNENKIADNLSRKQLFKNIPDRKQVVNDSFQIPNLFCTQQYIGRSKKDFIELRNEINNHYLFNFIEHEHKLEVYEMEKFPEIKILNLKTYNLEQNWIKQYLNIVNKVLENSPHESIGLIFHPQLNEISKLFRGLIPISKKAKTPLTRFKDLSINFLKIVVHNGDYFIKKALPEKIKETIASLSLEDQEKILVENFHILSDPDYKLGSNLKIERLLLISEEKSKNLEEIRKKYLGEIIKLNLKIEDENRRLNNEVIAKENKNIVTYRVDQIRQNLKNRGIKLKR